MPRQQGIQFHGYASLSGFLLATVGARNLNRCQHQLQVFEMVNVEHLPEHNKEVGHKYFDALTRLPWTDVVRDRGASWHSLRSIFIHTLRAVDYWLDALEGADKHADTAFDEYQSMEDLKHRMAQVERSMNEYLKRLSRAELDRLVEIAENGEIVRARIEDILIHLFEETVHRRGYVIASCWQMDVEPPAMGWRGLQTVLHGSSPFLMHAMSA